jgi:hypothetical protein
MITPESKVIDQSNKTNSPLLAVEYRDERAGKQRKEDSDEGFKTYCCSACCRDVYGAGNGTGRLRDGDSRTGARKPLF